MMKSRIWFAAILGGICLLSLPIAMGRNSIGTAVSDELATQLRGGCAGIGTNSCGGIDLPCPQTCVGNGSAGDFDPNSVTAYYCECTVNSVRACLTCSANYVSCARSGS